MSYLLLVYPIAICLAIIFGVVIGLYNEKTDLIYHSQFKNVDFKAGTKYFKIVNYKE